MLLAIVVMGVVAGVSFVNLGVRRNAALAAHRAAHEQLAEAQQQQAMLTQKLGEAQQGAHILPKAYDYFAETPPGVTTILLKPAAPAEQTADAAGRRGGPPFWADWWKALVEP
jgi:type II secretory pathway pseudopilin PulG